MSAEARVHKRKTGRTHAGIGTSMASLVSEASEETSLNACKSTYKRRSRLYSKAMSEVSEKGENS